MSDEAVQVPFEPKPKDIICTKLRTWNSKHPGNKFFNAMVQDTACKVSEENIKTTAEAILNVLSTQRGGRFLKLHDVDVVTHGSRPHVCTVMNRKQSLNKVIRTLKTAHARHHGNMPKRCRNPATRRKKAKEYELHSGPNQQIHPYALQLLSSVMNSTKNAVYRELDKPGEPYTTTDNIEPHQLRLMRLQLRHRLVGAKEAMMPAVEFGYAIMNLWGGRVEVNKIPLPSVLLANNNNTATGEDTATGTNAADNSIDSNGSGGNNNNNTKKNPNSTTQSKKESQEKKNKVKDHVRALTRKKMKPQINVGGADKTSPSTAAGKPIRGSLASKTLPIGSLAAAAAAASMTTTLPKLPKTNTTGMNIGLAAAEGIRQIRENRAAAATPETINMGGPDRTSPSEALLVGIRMRSTRGSIASKTKLLARAAAGKTKAKPTRGSVASSSRTVPARAGAAAGGGKTNSTTTTTHTTKPRRGSLASKTLPVSARTTTAAAAASSSSKATTTTTENNFGSLVDNVEVAHEYSPFDPKRR